MSTTCYSLNDLHREWLSTITVTVTVTEIATATINARDAT